jgi:hypothetical protein
MNVIYIGGDPNSVHGIYAKIFFSPHLDGYNKRTIEAGHKFGTELTIINVCILYEILFTNQVKTY